jgi:hypothetical protein
MGGETSQAPTEGADAMTVIAFMPRKPDRSQEIAQTIFRHINDGVGVDVDAVMDQLLADLDELGVSVAEINAGVSLAFRVLRVFERQLLNRFHVDGEGNAS